MDRVKGTRREVATQRVAQTPLTEKQLASFERSTGPAQHVMVKRLIHELRRSWERRAEIDDELRREQELRAAEKLGTERPGVLLVVHCDGWVEAYADKTVDVVAVELKPWDDDMNVGRLLSVGRRDKYGHLLNGTASLNCYPHYLSKPNQITEEALQRLLEWRARIDFVETWNELLGLLSKRLRQEK